MTKRNIVQFIAEELGLARADTLPIVQKTLDAIINILVAEGRIELRNFGVFEVRRRKARQARNPRTGEKVMVGERYVVTFKPGRMLEERVAMEYAGKVTTGEDIPSDRSEQCGNLGMRGGEKLPK